MSNLIMSQMPWAFADLINGYLGLENTYMVKRVRICYSICYNKFLVVNFLLITLILICSYIS